MRFALLLFVLAAITLALMATQAPNREDVSLLLPYTELQLSSPLILMVASSLGIGFLLGYLSGLPARIGAGRRARKAEQQLARVAPTAVTGASATGVSAAGDASETASIADEIARRTAAVQRDAPPSV